MLCLNSLDIEQCNFTEAVYWSSLLMLNHLFFQVINIATQTESKDLFHQIADKNKLQSGTFWGVFALSQSL